MANNGYQSTWAGALPTNQSQPPQPTPVQPQTSQQMQPVQNQQWTNPWFNPQPQVQTPDNPLIIIPVQSDAVVDNYIIPRGYTAFFINYANGIFWKKRQTDDGLGYDTVKHYFFTEEQFKQLQNQNAVPSNSDEINGLREELNKLRKEFEEFIK